MLARLFSSTSTSSLISFELNLQGCVEGETLKREGPSAEILIQVGILDLTRMDSTWNL